MDNYNDYFGRLNEFAKAVSRNKTPRVEASTSNYENTLGYEPPPDEPIFRDENTSVYTDPSIGLPPSPAGYNSVPQSYQLYDPFFDTTYQPNIPNTLNSDSNFSYANPPETNNTIGFPPPPAGYYSDPFSDTSMGYQPYDPSKSDSASKSQFENVPGNNNTVGFPPPPQVYNSASQSQNSYNPVNQNSTGYQPAPVGVANRNAGEYPNVAMEWDSVIEDDGKVVISSGIYEFIVTGLKTEKFPGSNKLPPCDRQIVSLSVITPNGNVEMSRSIFINPKLEPMIHSFFRTVRIEKEEDFRNYQWNDALGRKGKCKIIIKSYYNNGKMNIINDVQAFV